MKSFALSAVALVATLFSTAHAQTHTACNPLNTTGCPSMQALGGNASFNFINKDIDTSGKVWFQTNDGAIGTSQSGATFTIQQSGDAPEVQSIFYMLFGRYEIVMQAAAGQGIVSSAILQSEDLDEIDWEFLGGNTTNVMTNYYGKGDTSDPQERGVNPHVDFVPQTGMHNYTVDWTQDRIQWWIDGVNVRTLTPDQAKNGTRYPQTPMNLRIGIWAGGDKSKNAPGVVQWAGGETDFKQGPFTMLVQSVYAKDYTQGAEYSWEDMDSSGDWQKVKVINGTSTVLKEIQKPTGIKNNWSRLSQGAKIGILSAVAGILIVAMALLTFCCITQRRAGRREHAAIMARDQQEAAELQEYKKQMQAGKFGFGNTNHVQQGGHRGSAYRFSTNRF